MAQLRQDYAEFVKRGAQIVTLGPDGPRAFKQFWQVQEIPFVGLSDVGNKTAALYYQEFNVLKLGWVPAMFIVDLEGVVRYSHYGANMADIPTDEEVLKVLDTLAKE
jgi:peroxiredoxin Q/BCP